MKKRLKNFITIPEPDLKKKREMFMVSLRKKNKKVLFNKARLLLSSEEPDTKRKYEEAIELLELKGKNETEKVEILINTI